MSFNTAKIGYIAKRVTRVVIDTTYGSHSRPLFVSLRVLKV